MTTFDDRERGFEAKFAHDQELEFKTTARRNRLLGLWAAELMGLQKKHLEDYAKAKLASKGCDAIVANDVSDGVFGTAQNQATLVDLDGYTPIEGTSKAQIADFLVGYIRKRLA